MDGASAVARHNYGTAPWGHPSAATSNEVEVVRDIDRYAHTMSMEVNPAPEVLSDLYAVVLSHQLNTYSRVKWAPEHSAWLANHPAIADSWVDTPGVSWSGAPDAPREDDLKRALELATKAHKWCGRCGLTNPAAHFIAGNVYGAPTLYCVQAPSADVVGSKGGGGRSKHWGSPLGCRHVGMSFESDWGPGTPYIGTVAAHFYGTPLIADEVINLPWCSYCTTAAGGRDGEDERVEFMREQVVNRAKLIADRL